MPESGYSELKQVENEREENEENQVELNDEVDDKVSPSSPLTHANGVTSTAQTEIEVEKTPKKDEGKFPWKILAPAYFVLLCDSIQLSAIAPFLPQLCVDRFHISEENVGMASGLLIGSYTLAIFCSSFFMGHLSDLYGRRLLLMLGSGVGSLTTFVFGLSPYFFLSLAMRTVAGLANANNALTKAVMSDVAHGKHRVIAFAYHGATFSMARAVASAMSGLTTGFIINLPLLNKDEYVLPCFLGGIVQVLLHICALLPTTYTYIERLFGSLLHC